MRYSQGVMYTVVRPNARRVRRTDIPCDLPSCSPGTIPSVWRMVATGKG